MKTITIKELLEKLKKEKLNIIDIRNHYDYISGKIPTAINIDKYKLLSNPEKILNKQETYYIYCHSGTSSNYIVSKLNSLGYHTVNIIGGYNNYLLTK